MCFFHARISGKQLSLERLLAVSGDPRCFKDLSRVTDSALPSLNTHTEAMLLFHENTAGQEMELSNPVLGYLARVQRTAGPTFSQFHVHYPPFPSAASPLVAPVCFIPVHGVWFIDKCQVNCSGEPQILPACINNWPSSFNSLFQRKAF